VIPLDKQAHALAGAVIALALGYVLPAWIAFMAAAVAGLLKEVYDYYHPKTNTSDGLDFLATAAGGLLGAVFVVLTTVT
jgi:hypothetical protein